MRSATVDDLEALYRERYAAFVRVASAIAGDSASGVDAVQDAFANAIASRHTYRGEARLETWVWRIVIRSAMTALPRELPTRTEIAGVNGDRGESAGIRALVAALPERQRQAVFLRYFADLDYRAIAGALGVEVGTVSATLNAAHSALRRSLEEAPS